MACIYPNRTGWVGCFIMNADSRGKGLGAALWKEMDITFRQHVAVPIGLDAVPEQVKTYGRRGFESVGKIPLLSRVSVHTKPNISPGELDGSAEWKELRDVEPKELARVDLEHTGLDRTAYWVGADLANRPGSVGFAIIKSGKVTGFIYVREVENGHRFGPLYAEGDAEAKHLLYAAMERVGQSDGYHVEVFGLNPGGQRVFEEFGWEYVGLSYDRMWLHGRAPSTLR